MILRIFTTVLILSITQKVHAQMAYTSDVPTEDVNHWQEVFGPLTDMPEIVDIIYREPFKSDFIDFIPAGYPLATEIEINSHYGVRNHPVHKTMKFHRGTDLESKTGDKVISTGDGTVLSTGFDPALGNFVKIKHQYGFESIYGHLSKIGIKKGAMVKKGQYIGNVGATGTVTGPHLHYTIKKNGTYLDPFDFLYMNFKN